MYAYKKKVVKTKVKLREIKGYWENPKLLPDPALCDMIFRPDAGGPSVIYQEDKDEN